MDVVDDNDDDAIRRQTTVTLAPEEVKLVLQWFDKMFFAGRRDSFNEAQSKFVESLQATNCSSQKKTRVKTYMRDNWFNCIERWALYTVSEPLRIFRTNNIAEAHFRNLKYLGAGWVKRMG